MIRSILLDLGKVIVPFDFAIGYRQLEKLTGIPPETLRERIRHTGLVPQFESGKINSQDFVQQLCSALAADIPYSRFCEIWSSIFSRETLIPEAFLKQLHRHYRLILVSNTNEIHFEMIVENYPLLRHFDEWIVSYRVGAMKPSPAIFEAAVHAAQCRPEECFFTDDIPEYVEAARQFGIDAVLFESFVQLQHELQNRGVTASA